MQKEIRLNQKGLELCFFYDDRSISPHMLSHLKKDLKDFLTVLEKKQKSYLGKSFKRVVVNANLCGEYKIRSLNKLYRQKDKVTDVLSFPLQESIRNGDYDAWEGEIELGDIFICKQVCERQAKTFKISFFDEFLHLLTHGLLHLIGYDHELSEKEDKLMRDLEEKFIKDISKIKKRG